MPKDAYRGNRPPKGYSAEEWARIQGAWRGRPNQETPPNQEGTLAGELETHRALWLKVATEHGWAHAGGRQFIQVWVDDAGHVVDSISTVGMTADVIIPETDR
jgi:hypothetical protein